MCYRETRAFRCSAARDSRMRLDFMLHCALAKFLPFIRAIVMSVSRSGRGRDDEERRKGIGNPDYSAARACVSQNVTISRFSFPLICRRASLYLIRERSLGKIWARFFSGKGIHIFLACLARTEDWFEQALPVEPIFLSF